MFYHRQCLDQHICWGITINITVLDYEHFRFQWPLNIMVTSFWTITVFIFENASFTWKLDFKYLLIISDECQFAVQFFVKQVKTCWLKSGKLLNIFPKTWLKVQTKLLSSSYNKFKCFLNLWDTRQI